MSCQIHIDTPGPFYAGNPIQGRIVCNFHERFKIRGIKIRTYGDEHTEWMGTETYYNEAEKREDTRNVLLTGDNQLFILENMLYGGQGGDLHMGPGQFNYPFNIQIPQDLPSSFDNSNGYIRYTLKAIVDIPWATDIEDVIHFTLLSPINLNTFPVDSFQPTSRSEETTICCWCCAGGNISADINIAKSAFVPGETLKLYINLTNMSNVNVESIVTKMKQRIKSYVNTPHNETRNDDNVLAENVMSGVGAHGENKYDIEIPIPKTIIVPNFKHSSLFDVSYDVEVTGSIPGCHEDINVYFSVYMGHIQHQSQMPPGYEAEQQKMGYPQANNYPAAAPPYPGGPLPSNSGAFPQGPYPSYPVGQPVQYPPSQPAQYPPDQPAQYPPGQYPPGQPGNYPSGPPAQYPQGSQVPYQGFVIPGAPAPSEQMPYPGGNSMYPSIPPEKQGYEGGNPSAPTFEVPPPSYGDVTKKS